MQLPIDPLLPSLITSLREHPSLVLQAPTGAGKTTRVPPAVLRADLTDLKILLLEPRRVAARAAAARMAAELGETVGQTVGYQVRLDRKAGPDTKILVVTEGVLLAMLSDDPFLESVGVVLLDEIHERSLDADLALAVCRRLQAEVRPDLRIVAMSATLETERLATFLDAPVLTSEGRAFPVEIRYLPRADDRPVHVVAAEHARRLADATTGDVLVFLPGTGEIHRTAGLLTSPSGPEIVPLHGRLTPAEQDRALQPGDRQRIVLATNVAETSVTLPGVTAVLDAGLVRVLRHDPRRGLDRLVTEPNSKASADQRAGRAGRVGPGTALRLWTELAHRSRAAHDAAEIARVDLCGPVLALLAWGEPDVHAFPWLQAPAPHALDAALAQLQALGALDADRKLTPVGRAMAQLPTHPRLARLVVEGHARGALDEAALAAALLEDRPPFQRAASAEIPSDSDLLDQIDAIRGQPSPWRARFPGAVAPVRQAAEQLARRARAALGRPGPAQPDALHHALIAAWPDRLAVRRSPDDRRVLLANGRGAKLGPDTAVHGHKALIALDVGDSDDAEATVWLAHGLPDGLLPTRKVIAAAWDGDRIIGVHETRCGQLVLDRRPGAPLTPDAVAELLLAAAHADPDRVIPDEPELNRLRGRLRFAGRQHPDLPSADDTTLTALIPRLAADCRSLADLRAADWCGALLDSLTWPQKQALDAAAPARLGVPSGSQIALDYPHEGPPVLAVRIQELFGCSTTPTVGGQPVMLHLLAPSGRPQQVTQDLAGFWARTWPEVRKELRIRYPKHSWPDDPANAAPEARPKRRT